MSHQGHTQNGISILADFIQTTGDLDTTALTASVGSIKAGLESHRYICSDQIATAVFLAFHLRKPILFEGPDSDNPLAFRWYDADRTVLGKTMAEHLRFGVCYWHSFAWDGSDIFGAGTLEPLAALQGEHTQLEAWVNDSCQADSILY